MSVQPLLRGFANVNNSNNNRNWTVSVYVTGKISMQSNRPRKIENANTLQGYVLSELLN